MVAATCSQTTAGSHLSQDSVKGSTYDDDRIGGGGGGSALKVTNSRTRRKTKEQNACEGGTRRRQHHAQVDEHQQALKEIIRRILLRRLVCGSSRPYRPPGRPAAIPLAAVDVIEAAIEEQPVTSFREISRATGFARETLRSRLLGCGYRSRPRRYDGLTEAQKRRRVYLFTRLLNKLKKGVAAFSFCDESWIDCAAFKGPRFRIISKHKKSAAAALEEAAAALTG